MRPLHALAVLAAFLIVWGWWRLPGVRADIAQHRAAPHFARAAQAIADGHAESAATELDKGLTIAPFDDSARTLALRLARLEQPGAVVPTLVLADMPLDDMVTAPPASAAPALRRWSRQSPVPLAPVSTLVEAASPAPATPPAALSKPNPADALASEAYRALAAKDRGAAARGLRLAVAAAPDDPRAATWRRQVAMIEKRWWGSAYTLARASGGGGLAAAPVLGGGQSGAQLGHMLNPLSRQPTSLLARISAPNKDIGRDRHAVQAAFGLSWRPVQAASVTVERLVALGREARDAWTLRVAGGGATVRPEGARSWNDLSAYVEAGIVGVKRQDVYAAAQAHAGRAVALSETVHAAAGIGAWASVQRDTRTVGRVEVGPTVRIRADIRPAPVELSVDYRVRVAGNADPDTGPAATLSTNF